MAMRKQHFHTMCLMSVRSAAFEMIHFTAVRKRPPRMAHAPGLPGTRRLVERIIRAPRLTGAVRFLIATIQFSDALASIQMA
jgi:hypothetical protein